MENALSVVEKINSFYAQSFNQLITITVAFLAFIGVLVPVLITLYQARQLKNDKKELENYIQEKHSQIKEGISNEIQSFFQLERERLQNEFAALKEEIRLSELKAHAGLLHLQGNSNLGKGDFVGAFRDFLRAAAQYASAAQERNLQRVLRLAIEECLPKLDYRIKEPAFEIDETFQECVGKLSAININGRYDDVIKRLKLSYELACKKKPEAKKA